MHGNHPFYLESTISDVSIICFSWFKWIFDIFWPSKSWSSWLSQPFVGPVPGAARSPWKLRCDDVRQGFFAEFISRSCCLWLWAPKPKKAGMEMAKSDPSSKTFSKFWCRGSRLLIFSTGYSRTKIRHAVEKFQEFVVDTRWQEKALVATAWATKETLAWSHSALSGRDAAAWKLGQHWCSAAILPGKHKSKESGNSFWDQLHSSFEIVIPVAAVHVWFPNRCTTTAIPFWLNSLPASCISFVTLESPAGQA